MNYILIEGSDVPIEDFNKWIQALRRGDYKQGKGSLNPSPNHYCCLGVGCMVFIEEGFIIRDDVKQLIKGYYPNDYQVNSPLWLNGVDINFFRKTGTRLSELNDDESATFDEIADLLELVYIHKILD